MTYELYKVIELFLLVSLLCANLKSKVAGALKGQTISSPS